MGRPIGSKNKKPANKPRSSYDTYVDWYKKYTKKNPGLFRPMYDEEEFKKEYGKLTKAAISNPRFKNNKARWLARAQEYVDRSFEKKYRDITGKKLDDLSDPTKREQLFTDWAKAVILDRPDLTKKEAYDEARTLFQSYYY